MARGIIRKPSLCKMVGAYRSQWKRSLCRLFLPGYGRRGMGWLRDPDKAWYNWWYYRTSISIDQIFGLRPSRGALLFGMLCAAVVCVIAAPVDLTRAGVTAHRIKKARKARAERATSRSNGTDPSSMGSRQRTASSNRRSTRMEASSKATTSVRTEANSSEKKTSVRASATANTEAKPKGKPIQSYQYSASRPTPPNEPGVSVVLPKPDKSEEPTEPDENTPKSKPKREGDQYIRKRMIIAGSSYCDPATLNKLRVGTYFDLEAEPNNPHDKDAVKLTLEGEKIGYIARSDRLAFVACLRLKRRVYGVITDIITESLSTKYEFETWYEQEK